jgi:hypothetical protein
MIGFEMYGKNIPHMMEDTNGETANWLRPAY